MTSPFVQSCFKRHLSQRITADVNMRYLESISDRWIASGISDRQQAKDRRAKHAEHKVSTQGIQSGGNPPESKFAFSTNAKRRAEHKQYRCKHCKDELGWIKRVPLSDKPFDYMDKWEDCPCTKDRAIERLMKSSHITEKFRQKTLTNFITDGLPELVKESHQAQSNTCRHTRRLKTHHRTAWRRLVNPVQGRHMYSWE